MDVDLFILQDGDEVVTLAHEDENVTWVHSVVLHDVHDEEKVAPVVVILLPVPHPLVLHRSGVSVTCSQGLLYKGLLWRLWRTYWLQYSQVLAVGSDINKLSEIFTTFIKWRNIQPLLFKYFSTSN